MTDTGPDASGRRLGPLERREQILACAVRLFEQLPYDQVSTAEIARQAGIARPLIHHYFGSKRELYLEVLRRLSYVPTIAVKAVAAGTLAERVDASIDRFLTVVSRHRNIWLVATTSEGPVRDKGIEAIAQEADDLAADSMLEALGLGEQAHSNEKLRAMILAFGGLAKAACRQWLVAHSLDREDVHRLLTHTLLTIVDDATEADGRRPDGAPRSTPAPSAK